jgi:catechol-2,3-dioxygenase
MEANAILETILYGYDLDVLEHFYLDVLGLKRIAATPGRNVVLQCGRSALILFNANVSSQTGGKFPAHGAKGPGHIAFVAQENELERWRIHLEKKKIKIETEVTWIEGGTSLYFRDPAGNSVELAPPAIWDGLGRKLLKSLNNI